MNEILPCLNEHGLYLFHALCMGLVAGVSVSVCVCVYDGGTGGRCFLALI